MKTDFPTAIIQWSNVMKNLEEVFFPPRILYPPIKGEDLKQTNKKKIFLDM